MQLAAAQLQTHLAKGLRPLYTLHGDEPLLLQEAADAIREAARRNGYTERSVHTVVAGDSLSKIAKREYGDANAWQRIFEANRDIIKDPDLIHPGQHLVIPAKT